jgi:hypothetical protein
MASPPHPICSACSKPVEPGSLVVYEHGELRHVRCRHEAVELNALNSVDRAQAVRTQARQSVEESRGRRATRRPPALGACPLCVAPATITDWRLGLEWIAVEDWRCKGFFVWAPLWAERVRTLTALDRADVATQIRRFRAMGHEAWLTTTDGTLTGPLVVRTQRPDRPT